MSFWASICDPFWVIGASSMRRVWQKLVDTKLVWVLSLKASHVLGWILNTLAITANSGTMPVKISATGVWLGTWNDGLHVPMTSASHLKILCDFLQIPGWDGIYSLGDCFIIFHNAYFGLACVLWTAYILLVWPSSSPTRLGPSPQKGHRR